MASKVWAMTNLMDFSLDKRNFNGRIKGTVAIPQKADYFLLPIDKKLQMYKIKKMKINSEGNWEAKLEWCPSEKCLNCKKYFEMIYFNENYCPQCKP